MSATLKKIEEYVLHLDGMERCPECGFIWNDTGEGHFHDCRYYILQDQEDVLIEDGTPLKAPVVMVTHCVRGDERQHHVYAQGKRKIKHADVDVQNP
jgi:uncharacterized Zn ribbon protein